MKRCSWVNPANEAYIRYHDTEWGVPSHDDAYLFEMLLLECFQAGLSWQTILNKRENFRRAFDGFDPVKIAAYGDSKTESLMNDTGIIRNRKKIEGAIQNAGVFLAIQAEFGSFDSYIRSFTGGTIIRNKDGIRMTRSELSDQISADLKRRGMKFVGSVTIYSYLQAIGAINDHEPGCYLCNI